VDATELCFTPATELGRLIAARELSPVELAEAALARIDRLNPVLNAYLTVTADLARAQAEFDSVLLDYKEKGHRVELVGKETDEGHAVYHLRVTRKGGEVQQYFLDADTGIERKITSTLKGPAGETATATIEFGDFREVNGLMAPFTIKNILDGRLISQVTVSKVEFNVPVDDTLFQMPSK